MRAAPPDSTGEDGESERPAVGVATPPSDGARRPSDVLGAAEAAAISDGESSPDAAYQRRLGERLRAVRLSQGLRLQDVESRSDGRFKAVVVGSYERGDRAISAHKLAALADFYGIPVAELLPADEFLRPGAKEGTIRLAVDRVRASEGDAELAPLLRLVRHVQSLRGDYNGRVLSLRGDDLRTVAIALGVAPDALSDWLEERGLLL